jgi:hypothetical protein
MDPINWKRVSVQRILVKTNQKIGTPLKEMEIPAQQ